MNYFLQKPTFRRKLLARLGHPREHKNKIFVFVLFCVIIIAVSVPLAIYQRKVYEFEMGIRIRIDAKSRRINIENEQRKVVLEGNLGTLVPPGEPFDCTNQNEVQHKRCLRWNGNAELKVTFNKDQGLNCYAVNWQSLKPRSELQDCYDMRNAHWYGIGQMQSQKWPLEENVLDSVPLITGSYFDDESLGSVIERYMLSTRGVFIHIHRDSPVFISMNATDDNKQLCFLSQYEDSPYPEPSHKRTILNYTMCTHSNYKTLHDYYTRQFINVSQMMPELKYFRSTIWSTWGYFKRNITQDLVVQFSNDIKLFGLDHSLLTISDKWQSSYGDLTFDVDRFPNASAMIDQIKKNGFDVGLWVHPFVNIDAKSFQIGVNKDYFVHDAGGKVAGLTQWWHGPQETKWSNGYAAVIDTTKPEAYEWFRSNLANIKSKYKMYSLTFDAGEVSQLPSMPHYKGGSHDPNSYSRWYARIAESLGNQNPVRVGVQSQQLPLFIRINTNSITEVIPTVLTLGLLGYPFFITSPVGGNAYKYTTSKELYIRWMQLVTFLPVVHFSTPPSVYGPETIKQAQDMLNLRKRVVQDRVIALAQEYSQTRSPIIRPLWWLDPEDKVTQTISDQFLIGDDILVAPVLTVGTFERNIYLPKGTWQDPRNNRLYKGPQWLNGYQVLLNQVAYFIGK